jgi:hypothetical protein
MKSSLFPLLPNSAIASGADAILQSINEKEQLARVSKKLECMNLEILPHRSWK